VILGARTLDQLDDNLVTGRLERGDEETRLLDTTSNPGVPTTPTASAARPNAIAASQAPASRRTAVSRQN
jgi:hypothetical protein